MPETLLGARFQRTLHLVPPVQAVLPARMQEPGVQLLEPPLAWPVVRGAVLAPLLRGGATAPRGCLTTALGAPGLNEDDGVAALEHGRGHAQIVDASGSIHNPGLRACMKGCRRAHLWGLQWAIRRESMQGIREVLDRPATTT